MKNRFPIYLAILLVSLVACNQIDAPKGANPKLYLTVLEEGLTKQHDFSRWPQGQITILSGHSAAMGSTDTKSMRFTLPYLERFQSAEKDGLLKLAEKQQSVMEQIGNMGARFFAVTATEKLRQMADPKESNEKWLAVPIGTIKVLKIISEEPCKLNKSTPGDEFLLVVGLMSDTPTQHVKTLGPKYCTVEPQELKFLAILQLNPFDKSYKYLMADTGKPSETEWKSDDVAQMINSQQNK